MCDENHVLGLSPAVLFDALCADCTPKKYKLRVTTTRKEHGPQMLVTYPTTVPRHPVVAPELISKELPIGFGGNGRRARLSSALSSSCNGFQFPLDASFGGM